MSNIQTKEELIILSIIGSISLTIVFITKCFGLGLFNIPFNPTNFILIIILTLIFSFIIICLLLSLINKYC